MESPPGSVLTLCRPCEIAGYLEEDGWPGAKWHRHCKGHGCECECGRRVHEPHWGFTKLGQAVHRRTVDHLPAHNAYARFNKRIALALTNGVGTMTCFWLFCCLSLCSLPSVLSAFAPFAHAFPAWMVKVSIIALVAWIAQTCFQLVLLPALMVGQNLQNVAADARAGKTFEDVEAVMNQLDLPTEGGLAVLLSEIKDARVAAETASEAMKMLTYTLQPKTPMVRKGRATEP